MRQRCNLELLAPAGGSSQLEAAVRFGADAVYLGLDRFGMRARADNFTLESVGEAIEFAHAAGVKVHVTLNTLMDSHDIEALPAVMQALQQAGADAFIVSDLGAFSLARQHAPKVELHVSTQASVANAESAKMWHSLGAKRVVCAREMSVKEIARMRESVPDDLEIEVFVHGAMCMAYSGRCLLSSAMTGRSANKGACAQSCRWSYALVEEKRPGEYFALEEDARGSYVMNAQDLNMLAHLDDLAQAGVDSIKIEGRNKRAFYVATVVNAYRGVLDGADPAEYEDQLISISHRPYSTGFYYGRATQTHERDGYLKECLHAATVESCEPEADGLWRVRVTCHNRFMEADVLDALSPHRPLRPVRVRGLLWHPQVRDPQKTEAAGFGEPAVPVDGANRAAESYSFLSDLPLEKGDYLSIRL